MVQSLWLYDSVVCGVLGQLVEIMAVKTITTVRAVTGEGGELPASECIRVASVLASVTGLVSGVCQLSAGEVHQLCEQWSGRKEQLQSLQVWLPDVSHGLTHLVGTRISSPVVSTSLGAKSSPVVYTTKIKFYTTRCKILSGGVK